MKSSYLDLYTIVQTFKDNEFQKIFVGTDNKSNQAVVINTIFTNDDYSLWDSIEKNYKSFFNNVIHFERLKEKIVLVTEVGDGLSLSSYLNNFSPSFTERTNLIYQYIRGIKKYEFLPNNIKSILVDKSQLVIDKGNLFFDELIIFNENSFYIKSFDSVIDNIVSILKELTSIKDINYEELPLYIKIMGFLDKLKKNENRYTSLSELSNGLEALNIEDYIIENNSLNNIQSNSTSMLEQNSTSMHDTQFLESNMRKKTISNITLGTTGIIAVSLVGIFAFKSLFPLDRDPVFGSNLQPNNTVNLNIEELDENNGPENISKESNDKKAISPNDDIYYLSENIRQDFNTSKYADYSLKLCGQDNSTHKISINTDNFQSNPSIFMWIKSDTSDEIKISIEGYSEDILNFQKSICHKASNVNTWELVQLTIDRNIKDNIDIVFSNINGTIWIDQIRIDILK